MTAESHSANRGSIPRGSTSLQLGWFHQPHARPHRTRACFGLGKTTLIYIELPSSAGFPVQFSVVQKQVRTSFFEAGSQFRGNSLVSDIFPLFRARYEPN